MNFYPINKKLRDIKSFIVMDILEYSLKLQGEGKNIIHFEIGEPDFSAPEVVKKFLKENIEKIPISYTHSLGIWELREEIARYYKNNYGVNIEPERIIIVPGTSIGFFVILLTLINTREKVIHFDPGYPCYPNFIKLVGGIPKPFYIYEEDAYIPDVKKLKKVIDKNTRAIILASPSNPTGTIIPPEILKEISELGIMVISDEIYHGLVYEGKAETMLKYDNGNVFVVNGFSKLFAMTGMRIGWIIVPKNYVPVIQKIMQNVVISVSTISQYAGLIALREAGEEIKKMVEEYKERRDLMLKGLEEMGFAIKHKPQGAFYIFLNVEKYTNDSYKFSYEILEKANVAVTPGIDFGNNQTNKYIRLSYTTNKENIKEGLKRLKNFIYSLNKQ